jgi:hypothetical protein
MRRKSSEREKREIRLMLTFYRRWMCRVRTRDLIHDLGSLEGLFRRRAKWLGHYCQPHPLLSEHSIKAFLSLEQQERSLVDRIGFMREKLSWVLDDLNSMDGIPTPSATVPAPSESEPLANPNSGSGQSSDQTAALN